MNTLKSIGGTLLGIAIFIGIIIATVLFFTLGAKVAFTIAPRGVLVSQLQRTVATHQMILVHGRI